MEIIRNQSINLYVLIKQKVTAQINKFHFTKRANGRIFLIVKNIFSFYPFPCNNFFSKPILKTLRLVNILIIFLNSCFKQVTNVDKKLQV